MAGVLLSGCLPMPAQELERLPVTRDDTRIERSCRLELGERIHGDQNGDGVLHVSGDGITVELAGELRGAPADRPADTYSGIGIRVTGKNVTLRGARVAGFKVGIHAERADGLVLEDCDVSGNFRQRLLSTKEKEAPEDWLDPHHNDERQWFTNYGAGIFVERSSGVIVRRCRARAGQNGLVLDRCERAQVYDNDFSFLSGWGIALWRSSDNVISRNACDFCVRGYSHGVYNRGQDSAGILLFEQCSRNVIAENSATHCGDGFFAFAGQEALGGVPPPTADFDNAGKGCNGNLIYGNDFSYAAAHGLELTFSFDNTILSNRLVGNSICGIWAGYSRDTVILSNEIEENGANGYGLERGGINIEHGQRNQIEHNLFRANECGVHLWWDVDEHLVKLPWCKANGDGCSGSRVRFNHFAGDKLAVHLRSCPATTLVSNSYQDVERRLEATEDSWVVEEPVGNILPRERLAGPKFDRAFSTAPVGARSTLRGRDKIQLDEWGPVEPR